MEFSLNYGSTNLATLVIKTSVRKSKINSAKNLHLGGIEPGTSCASLRCLPD